ncbi:MAG: Hsp20/alpha crystallin family protein [Hyphomicrobiales bacterium]|nr:Hsp20/alpha crystallin family protein [Hyphomicrobiales bacterium]
MAKAPEKTTVQKEEKAATLPLATEHWRPLDSLRREVDRLFEDFHHDFWRSPLPRSVFDIEPLRRQITWGGGPAADIVEKEKAYEVRMELPGIDEKDIEVSHVGDRLTIRGEKHEEKEEEKKGYHLRERHFGSFERRFRLPEGINAEKIEASFKKGILTVTMPKTADTRKPEKKIKVKGG